MVTRSFCWWRASLIAWSERNFAALANRAGVEWRRGRPKMQASSGSATHASQRIVLCESAIDAISCHALDRERICISTSGVRANPRWLPALIVRGHTIDCGFDADEAGDEAAKAMMTRYPLIQRLRPSAKDWNDVLLAHNARSNTTQNHPSLSLPISLEIKGSHYLSTGGSR